MRRHCKADHRDALSHTNVDFCCFVKRWQHGPADLRRSDDDTAERLQDEMLGPGHYQRGGVSHGRDKVISMPPRLFFTSMDNH